MTPFPLSILTPAGALLNGEAVFIGVRSVEGALGVLAQHAPMVVACPPGVVRVQTENGWNFFATGAAILSTDGKKVVVLADRAEPAADESAAQRSVQNWQQEQVA